MKYLLVLLFVTVVFSNTVLDEIEDFGLEWTTDDRYSFYIQTTEATVGQYKKCIDAGACDNDSVDHYGSTCTYSNYDDNYPINCVTYFGAEQFCNWIGGDLCTPDEWSDACKGGNRNYNYPYGESFEEGRCNVATYEDRKTIQPIKSNELCVGGFDELYDMGGNVSEWLKTVDPRLPETYAKTAPAAYQGNHPGSERKICNKICGGTDKTSKFPPIGIRCCRNK